MWGNKQMLRAILFALLLCRSTNAACSQAQFNVGDSPSPKPAQPVPLDTSDWRRILAPQGCPNGSYAALNACGDGRDGYVWGFNSFTGKMSLRPPKILYGPGAITSSIALTQNAWTNLFGA